MQWVLESRRRYRTSNLNREKVSPISEQHIAQGCRERGSAITLGTSEGSPLEILL